MSDNMIQVYSIYIDAPAAKVWEAVTTSELTNQWGYGGDVDYDLVPGGEYRNSTTDEMKAMGMGDVAVSGRVLEVDPPHRLALSWKASWYPEAASTTLTWEFTEYPSGLTRVVLTHDVTAAPQLAAEIAGAGDPAQGGGGWPWALAGLKTLLETGSPMGRQSA